MDVKSALARWLRRRADRLDPDGAFKPAGLAYTQEDRWGVVVNADGRGCPLWYRGSADKARASLERRNVPKDLDEIEFITAGFKDAGMVTVYGSAEVTNAQLSRRVIGYDLVGTGRARPARVPRHRITLTCEIDSFVILQGRTYQQAVEEMFKRGGSR